MVFTGYWIASAQVARSPPKRVTDAEMQNQYNRMVTYVEMEIAAVLWLTHIMRLSAVCTIRTIPGK